MRNLVHSCEEKGAQYRKWSPIGHDPQNGLQMIPIFWRFWVYVINSKFIYINRSENAGNTVLNSDGIHQEIVNE